MQLERIEKREQWLLSCLQKKAETRLAGRHVTDGIWCNIKSFGAARLHMAGHDVPFDRGAIIRICTGIGLGHVIEEGHISQIEAITTADDSVGTVDVYWQGHPNEIKVTWQSSRKTPVDNPYWLEQLGDYMYRTMPEHAATAYGEFWVVHLGGDQGKKLCLEHGVPDERVFAKHPDTGSRRLICPACREFLADGDREPDIRCWGWHESRATVKAYHDTHIARLAQLEQDISNAEFQVGGDGSRLPPVRWGYQEIECKNCRVKERIACPGFDNTTDLADALEGSILDLQEATSGS